MRMGRVVGLLASVAVVGAVIGIVAWRATGAVGYVEIKTVPTAPLTQAALYIDAKRLGPIKEGSAILTQPVGTRKLQARGFTGSLTALCKIEVRKDRITTVTISVLERPPHCQCRFTGSEPANARTHECVS
jgi:hypothetical protein